MPSILAFNASHDGAAVLVEDGELVFSIEAEKDSHNRHDLLSIRQVIQVANRLRKIPDVLAIGGWSNFLSGYTGLDNIIIDKRSLKEAGITFFSSSHERSHLISTYAMSPYAQGEACYLLIWEGTIGCFYRVDEKLNVHRYPDVLSHPGWRYAYLYYLGMNCVEPVGFWGRMEMAGKMMALAGVASPLSLSTSDGELIDWILRTDQPIAKEASAPHYLPSEKAKVPLVSNIFANGVENDRFRSLAHHFSNALFEVFHSFARKHLTDKLPLLISGGCGLNCDWNTKWKECSLFPDVFVPPCPNDSGSAIGSAVDAQLALTGNAKLKWTVYSGAEFVDDCVTGHGWDESPLDLDAVAKRLFEGAVIPWVQGRCEIGPRALGNRSLFAAPFGKKTTAKLNHIKMREGYRPIAPICLEEDVSLHFEWAGPSPYMLYFQKVTDRTLSAIEHDDGTARVQTVNAEQNKRTYDLLSVFKDLSGKGVLCNTSLNFRHRGFINRKSDLIQFADEHKLECCVMNDTMLVRHN